MTAGVATKVTTSAVTAIQVPVTNARAPTPASAVPLHQQRRGPGVELESFGDDEAAPLVEGDGPDVARSHHHVSRRARTALELLEERGHQPSTEPLALPVRGHGHRQQLGSHAGAAPAPVPSEVPWPRVSTTRRHPTMSRGAAAQADAIPSRTRNRR